MHLFLKHTVALLILLAGASPALAMPITTHRALYDFHLLSVAPGAEITGVKGQMYFEQDDVCDAWTMEHRFTTEYQYAEQPTVVNTSRYVAFESKDRQQFSFNSEYQENGQMLEQLRGSADRAEDGSGRAVYSRPGDLKYDLPKNYMLPTLHTSEIIRHARQGDSFFNAILFDGTDADGPVEANVFIGKKVSAAEIKKIASRNKKIDSALLAPEAWHIRMAIFPLKEDKEMTPAYEMNMILHINGVVSYVQIDYNTFKLEQNLLALEKIPVRKCR